jgi:hypothetical protein
MTKRITGVLTLALALATTSACIGAQTPASNPNAAAADAPATVRKTYRLLYTITESDGGKHIGVQHFAMVVVSGKRATLKDGSKVPVVTGSYDQGKSGAQTQFTYLDVGINFDTTLTETASGLQLSAKVEQSSVQESAPIAGVNEPVIRQAVLETTTLAIPGKPLVLGALDLPGSTRHLDVEVTVEPLQ